MQYESKKARHEKPKKKCKTVICKPKIFSQENKKKYGRMKIRFCYFKEILSIHTLLQIYCVGNNLNYSEPWLCKRIQYVCRVRTKREKKFSSLKSICMKAIQHEHVL